GAGGEVPKGYGPEEFPAQKREGLGHLQVGLDRVNDLIARVTHCGVVAPGLTGQAGRTDRPPVSGPLAISELQSAQEPARLDVIRVEGVVRVLEAAEAARAGNQNEVLVGQRLLAKRRGRNAQEGQDEDDRESVSHGRPGRRSRKESSSRR